MHRLYEGDHAFILQNDDRRVIFVYPYETHYTLIGTTEVPHESAPDESAVSAAEVAYLCAAANRYFARTLTPADVIWRYSGVRPLVDDGSKNMSHITRDYTLHLDGNRNDAPLLSIFGGKITTYRKLAEHALEKLTPWFEQASAPWTANTPLPGGALNGHSFCEFVAQLTQHYSALPSLLVEALAARHGGLTDAVLGGAKTIAELGQHFGHTLYAREVDYLITHEWARTADDVLWRRTKCGLHLNIQQKQALEEYVTIRAGSAVRK